MADAKDVTCPVCDAEPGQPCWGITRLDGRREPRQHNHRERQALAVETTTRNAPTRRPDLATPLGRDTCHLCDGTGFQADSTELIKTAQAVEHTAAWWTTQGWTDRTIPAGFDVSTRYVPCSLCRPADWERSASRPEQW